ncbi:MAG: hypothetical protein AAF430_01305 [Myxococcota bacterium]
MFEISGTTTVQATVTAHYVDGTSADVTSVTQFLPLAAGLSVSPTGLITISPPAEGPPSGTVLLVVQVQSAGKTTLLGFECQY